MTTNWNMDDILDCIDTSSPENFKRVRAKLTEVESQTIQKCIGEIQRTQGLGDVVARLSALLPDKKA